MSKIEISTISMEELPDFKTPYDFWEWVYLNHINPRPECSSCNEKIEQPSQWIAFTCKCQKYYHKKCIYENFDVLVCPECRDSKQIYAFPRFLCKFMEPERYYQIYKDSIKNLNNKQRLKIYKLWFHTYSIYTPPFLDLYDYLEPHNMYETIKFLEEKKNNHKIECFDPAFTVEDDGLTYNSDEINYEGKRVFNDLTTFKKRLQEFTYNLIDDDFPYKNNVVLAGGGVHKCLESRIDLNKVPEYSNLDIFICHPDLKILTKDTKKVIKYFQDRHSEDNIFWVHKNTNVIRLYVSGYNRMIQLVLFKNTIENIVSKFDFSHVQYVYDGKTIKSTLPGLEYANYLVSVHDGYYDVHFPKRFQKAKDLKLCLALPMPDSMSIRIPNNITIDCWYPNYTDKVEHVKSQMRVISGVRQNKVSESKPIRIYYSKIPEEFSHSRFSFDNSPASDDQIVSYIEQETLFNTY
mgnify:CR=1 FL=1|tara:strand:- start:2026 stop:3414 length:1389 start_codon:yes stop_codon:yes gene_type:complete